MSKINIRFGATPGEESAALQELNVARGKSDGTIYPDLRSRLDAHDASLAQIATLVPSPNGIDDTTSLQNVFNNISNKTVTISNDYIVGTPSSVTGTNTILFIVGQSNFKIKGNNGSIKLKNGTGNKTVLAIIDCSNFEIDGLVIDGNKANQTIVQSGVSGRFYSENCPAILLENAKKFKVKNCSLKNAQGDGVQLDVIYLNQSNTSGRQCEDGEIYGNTIDNIGRNGLSFVHSKNVKAYNNTFTNIHLDTTTLACGIDVEVNAGYLYRNENLSIFNNAFKDCAVGVQVLMALSDDVTQNINMFMNDFKTCGVAGQFINLAAPNGKNINFYLNKIDECNNGVSFDECSYGKVYNNIINKCVRTNSTNGFGVVIGTNRTGQNSNIAVEDNKIIDCDNVGIYADRLSSSTIVNNNIKNTCLSASVTEKTSIRLLHLCDGVKINKNSINDGSIPIALTELGSTISNIEIANNDITSTNGTIYWFVMASTATVTKDYNRVNGVTELGLLSSYGAYGISASQNIASTVDTQILFNSTTKTNGLFTLLGDGTIKVLKAGTYLLQSSVTFALNTTGRRQVSFSLNGGVVVTSRIAPVTDFATIMNLVGFVDCAANDIIKVNALQQSGVALDVLSASLNVKKVG